MDIFTPVFSSLWRWALDVWAARLPPSPRGTTARRGVRGHCARRRHQQTLRRAIAMRAPPSRRQYAYSAWHDGLPHAAPCCLPSDEPPIVVASWCAQGEGGHSRGGGGLQGRPIAPAYEGRQRTDARGLTHCWPHTSVGEEEMIKTWVGVKYAHSLGLEKENIEQNSEITKKGWNPLSPRSSHVWGYISKARELRVIYIRWGVRT
jgi:hypothetical protein